MTLAPIRFPAPVFSVAVSPKTKADLDKLGNALARLVDEDPIDLADNLRKNGGFIPGVRPGSATVRYIENVLNRITLPGAVFLGVIAVAPSIVFSVTNDPLVTQFGGASILIMVGVALETMTQIESQLKIRPYEGFFK